MSRALVLAGHGSHLDPASSRPVHDHAARLRARGAFDEVHVAFWKEEPALSRILDAVDADDVTIVPVFISDGYFVREVVPREAGVSGPVSCVLGKLVRYTGPVGSHPALADVIVQRALEAGAGPSTGIAVLGHGTPRNPGSERNVLFHTELVSKQNRFAAVAAVFLEQEPDMRGVFGLLDTREIVMVPLFVAEGWHVGVSIPEDMAIDRGELRRGGRTLRYSAPVGTHPLVTGIIEELAVAAAAWR